MISFRQFYLLEYLTPAQIKKYSAHKMTSKARADTDHFFGKDNDHVREEIINYDHDKSEVHKQVENHLGTHISPEDYKSGIIKDKYNRPIKLGRAIKDETLRNAFASDNTRALSKQNVKPHMSIVRGVEVAGQTNPEPDADHPSGHSWKDESCKNITDGSNKKYLAHEIKHGTVLVRAHDHKNKEIYRATLQPYHNDQGHVAYMVNGEYGVKHPSFTSHAHNVAMRLSGDHKGGGDIYDLHPNVYDDFGKSKILHPNLKSGDLSKYLNSKDHHVRIMAMQHPNTTAEHITKGVSDNHELVRYHAITHPKANAEHLTKALEDVSEYNRVQIAKHQYATADHINKLLNDKSTQVKVTALESPHVTAEHINTAMNDKNYEVRAAAVKHPNATLQHVSRALKDKVEEVRQSAIQNPNVTPEHITHALNSKNEVMKQLAMRHRNVTGEHINTAMNDKNYVVRALAARHPNATLQHISTAIKDKEPLVRMTAFANPNVTAEHISHGLTDKDSSVRFQALQHPKASTDHFKIAATDKDARVRDFAKKSLNVYKNK
jgi:hypothetical protein